MIIIPMAGLSSRFRDAGYTIPKYMLTAQGRTLFAHSVGSFSEYFQNHFFLFICRDIFDTPAFIEAQCRMLGIKSFRCVVLDGPTSGQAETVALGLEHCNPSLNEPITIFNIDTFRPGFKFPTSVEADGYLEVFQGTGDNWSYVRPKGNNSSSVAETAEKRQISIFCCTGLYYFHSINLYRRAYNGFVGSADFSRSHKEIYVAPLYNVLIESGGDIRYHLIKKSEVIFCGVPKEYEDFINARNIF